MIEKTVMILIDCSGKVARENQKLKAFGILLENWLEGVVSEGIISKYYDLDLDLGSEGGTNYEGTMDIDDPSKVTFKVEAEDGKSVDLLVEKIIKTMPDWENKVEGLYFWWNTEQYTEGVWAYDKDYN